MRQTLCALLLLLCSPTVSAAVTGRVLDEDGRPLAGARVRIRAIETTDEARARMLSKEPQPVVLAATESSQAGAFRVETKGNAVVDLMIDMPGREFAATFAADKDDVTVVLARRPSRKGRVTAAGRGVSGATVFVGWLVAKTDAEGRYEVPDGPFAMERIAVVHPDYAITERMVRPQTLQLAQSFDVALQAPPPLRGRVVDAAGKPVPNAIVRAGGWPVARSGEDGSFEIAHPPADKSAISALEGNRVGSLTANVITLRPAASITGTVRSSQDEMPVPAARIMLRDVVAAVSDPKGNFAIEGLDAADTFLSVWHPAFMIRGAEIQIEAGARMNQTLIATPLGRLAGRVIDDEQRPVAAVRLTVPDSGIGTASAPDGTFSLRLPADRSVSISALKPPYATVMHGPFSVQPGELKRVEIRLAPGFPFELRLTDRDGVPIANEPLFLRRLLEPGSRRFEPVPCGASLDLPDCRSDARGRITLTLVEGMYAIHAGGVSAMQRELPNEPIDAKRSPMTIELDRGAVIDGRVTWSDGTPAKLNGIVRMLARTSITAPLVDGAFTMRVPPGKIKLIVEAAPPQTIRSEPIEVTAPASGVALLLPRAGGVQGRVVERESRKPVRNFTALLLPRGSFEGTLRTSGQRSTTEDGRFLVEQATPGTYDLRITASGYASTTAVVVVEEGKITDADEIFLEPGGTIAGRVTSAGRAVADVQVSAALLHGRGPRVHARSDANGEFRLTGLAVGPHRLELQRGGFVTVRTPVDVVAGPETRADVELSRGREVRGRVFDSSGRPLPGVSVSARDLGTLGGTYESFWTDVEGSFRIPGLADTVQTIVASKEGFVEGRIEVNPAISGEVTITLERGGAISGRILGVTPAELPFVEVYAYGSSSVNTRAQPDASGAFMLPGVADGEFTVVAALLRPVRREVRVSSVRVVNGIAPPVDLDFKAGVGVRGRVTLRGRVIQGTVRFRGRDSREAISSQVAADGTYELRLPKTGEYQASVSRHGTGESLPAGRLTITGETVYDIELRGATVTGVVVDAETHRPVSGATVAILQAGEQFTNSMGRFTFDVVSDGEFRVRVQKDGFAPLVSQLSVRDGAAPELELALSRGLPVVVHVIDLATGAPVDAAVFVSLGRIPVYSSQPEGDSDGLRSFALHAGTYELGIVAPLHEPATVAFTVPGPPVVVKVRRREKQR